MALSEKDFTNYPWQDVVQDQENQFSCWSFCTALGDRMKEMENLGDAIGVEFYYLLWSLASMTLDSSDPKKPLLAMESGRSLTFLDISEEHLEVLAEVVSDLEIESDFMRARIADVLWLRKKGYQFAQIAYESYLATVDANVIPFSVYTKDRIIRALQIALEIDDFALLDRTVQIAEQITLKYFEDRRNGIWTALELHLFLVSNCQKDPNIFADLISEEIRSAEELGDTTRAENLRGQRLKLFQAAKEKELENQFQLETAEALVSYAKNEATLCEFSSAHSKIERAISHLRLMGGKRTRIIELRRLLHEYGRNSSVNFEWFSSRSCLSESELQDLNSKTASLLAGLEDNSLQCALKVLARSSEMISTKQATDLINKMSLEPFASQDLVSWEAMDNLGKVISRDSPLQSLCACHGLRRGFAFVFMIAPAVAKITSNHDANMDDLVSIAEDSQFIPPDRQQVLARGLLAGLQSDYMLAAHLLPPQLEHALRTMLVAAGEITSKLTEQMIEEEYPLGTIIRNEKLEEILGEDMILDLKCLLAKDKGSLNLRNRLAHGLLPDACFLPVQYGKQLGIQADVMYLWWLTLKLCFQFEYQQPDC